ncbi:unnamed protein product [Allacma fusca]|uniref:Glycolipid transfer protein domain-containing protein n=1 Tax=Allacma fusca TaxID=39272 RepID=A0A8J2JQQ4_9HEXA|nr:unnamed protein product [Allacma fusca]
MNSNENKITPWPIVGAHGVPTNEFLCSCDVVVQIFGALGTVLAPVKSDVEGNVSKLRKLYSTNQVKYEFLEDMIRCELAIQGSVAPDSLLWLTRALHFVYVLLESVTKDVLDGDENPDIKSNYLSSYNDTLRKYHNWAIQKVFTLCINGGLLPKCRELLMAMPSCRDAPEETTTTDLAGRLKSFVDGLQSNIAAITTFFQAEGLDSVETRL